MNKKLYILAYAAMAAVTACNQSGTEQVEKIKSLAAQDSLRATQANQKDSLITAYLDDLNDIQETLDRIKEREKIITLSASGDMGDKRIAVDEIRELDNWILDNDNKMNSLQQLLKRMNTKNTKLENMVIRLTKEIAEKDDEISQLQARLGKADDSVRLVTKRFNDSILVIQSQRMDMAQLNTVYYISGTMKELKDKGVIDKEGGFIGIGRVAALSSAVNNTVFTKTSLGSLQGIRLHGKFRRLITTHPDKSYKVIIGSKADSIAINMPAAFWSESKYLVIATK